jgi:hypothetical protein
MALIKSIFWFVLFLVATFVFTVIFEHGFDDFSGNAQREFDALQKIATSNLSQKKDTSDKAP